ncbi:MAG: IS5/IS1182 family transposase, partial [Gammaproteobacteria bacterium]|nr:IS5/IS1182 family transposase [Gammaproteobacteria bacterium]
MSQPRKPRYRTSNWKQYNASLKARGSLTVWLDKGMCWFATA